MHTAYQAQSMLTRLRSDSWNKVTGTRQLDRDYLAHIVVLETSIKKLPSFILSRMGILVGVSPSPPSLPSSLTKTNVRSKLNKLNA